MKFATLALLVASVSAEKGKKGGKGKDKDIGLTDAQGAEWFKLVTEDMGRMDDLPRGSPLRKMWLKWMRGDAKKEIQLMKGMLYEDGGPWDQAAGDDGSMNFEEATAMDAGIRAEMEKEFSGAKWPERPDGYFKRAYDVYDALSEGEGFTKMDARKGDKIVERIRRDLTHWKPTKEQKEAMKPVWEQEMQRFDDLPEGKLNDFSEAWLNGRPKARMASKKMGMEIYKDGGIFDQGAGDDGMMDLKEARAMNDMFRKKAIPGEEIIPYTDEQFKLMYDAYDSLSEGDGISKIDAMVGQGTIEKFRDHRIGEDEIDKFYPMGMLEYYDYISDLDDESDARKLFDHILEQEQMSDEEKKQNAEMFKKADKDGNRRLDHHEWMTAAREMDDMMKTMLGEDAPEWSHGEQEFFWTMANSVKYGHWNQWGSHADGVSKHDLKRLGRIMKQVLSEIAEDEEDSDSDSDSDDDNEEEENDNTDADFLLI